MTISLDPESRTALTVLALPVMASAQTMGAERVDEVRREASGHVGPLYFTPQVLLKELGVDSNVFNAAGEPKSDFTFTVGPRADVWVPVARRALFQVRAATDLVWYANYATERSIDPQFLGRAEIYIRRITLFAEGEYRQHPGAAELRSRRCGRGTSRTTPRPEWPCG